MKTLPAFGNPYNIKDRYTVAVVKSQDHVDAIENDRLTEI